MVFIDLGVIYKAEFICKGGIAKMARPSFSGSFLANKEFG